MAATSLVPENPSQQIEPCTIAIWLHEFAATSGPVATEDTRKGCSSTREPGPPIELDVSRTVESSPFASFRYRCYPRRTFQCALNELARCMIANASQDQLRTYGIVSSGEAVPSMEEPVAEIVSDPECQEIYRRMRVLCQDRRGD